MRILKAAAMAALLAFAGCATSGETSAKARGSSGSEARELAYAMPSRRALDPFAKQTAKVRTECFPAELKAILHSIHAKFGVQPVVTSGHRPRAGKSQHSSCKAADIRVPGVSASSVAKYARSIRGVGGVGTYGGKRSGIVHVDVGARRDWHHRH
jgi:Uncharacterized protein conserved in bacteria